MFDGRGLFLFLKSLFLLEVAKMQKLLNAEELAQTLGVDKSWLYNKTRNREIPFHKLGKYVRFDPAAIQKWLESQKQGVNVETLEKGGTAT